MGIRTVSVALAMLGSVVLARPAAAACQFVKIAELPVTMNGLRPIVPAKINGKDALFIIDSGDFFSTLGPDAAAKYGMSVGPAPVGLGGVRGIGGETRTVRSTTANDFIFGNIDFHKADFLVNERGFGAGAVGLIGQNILHAADVEYDLANGVIRLFGAKDCEHESLAYWAGSQPYSEIDLQRRSETEAFPLIKTYAQLNGHQIRVTLDTGAPRSLLTLNAAARVGVHPTDPGVVAAGMSSGVALHSYLRTWLAPFADFKIGDEEVKNFQLLIGETQTDELADLLIGEDFFLSHRILVSNSQNKLYFTYSGGPVFNMKMPPKSNVAAEPESADANAEANAPLDAEGYSRRAAAETARRDFKGAVADLTQAITLKPDEPRYYYQRGLVDERLLGNPASPPPYLPIADFNHALTLKPDYISALLARSILHVARREPDLAKADLDAADKAAAGDPDQRLKIADTYVVEGHDKEALAELDQWIDANPKSDALADALGTRCRLRGLSGLELDKALSDCNASLKLAPGNPPTLESRGLVRLRMGEFDKSIADYDEALRITPNNAWSLYGRGLAKLRKGMKAEGQADLQAAATVRPQIAADAAKRGLTP